MLILKLLQKTVLCTVFFYALILQSGCKSLSSEEDANESRLLSSKFIVKFSIITECLVNQYRKDAQIIFFPLLKLNSDGSLLSNYKQLDSLSEDYFTFSSNDNINNTILAISDQFCSKFDFYEEPLLFTLPRDLKKSYLVRFYYYVNSDLESYNSVYIKSSIEYIDPEGSSQLPINVWTGEGNFAFDKSIVKGTFLDVAFKKVFEYAFKNSSDNGKFHLLDM